MTSASIRGAEALLAKIATVEKLIGKERPNHGKSPGDGAAETAQPMIAIGSSTGGPKALAELLSRLPGTCNSGSAGYNRFLP